MLRGCVLGLALVAACSSDHGVFFVITSPQKLARVELFIGDQPISICGAPLTPPCTVVPKATGSGSSYPADVYTQSVGDAIYTNLDGTKLTYHIDPGEDPHVASAVLVVGYDGAGAVVADKVIYNVPIKSSALEIDVTLDPADPLTGDPSKERIGVWRRPGDTEATQSACALVRHPNSARDNDYFAPSDDYDCDGAVMKTLGGECSTSTELAWCAVVPEPQVKQATCVATAESGACRLAAPPCVDGGGTGSCAPAQATCVPTGELGCTENEICDALSQLTPSCDSLDLACLGRAFSGGVPHVSCPLTVTTTTYCPVLVDPNTSSFAQVLNGRMCTMAGLAPISMPFTPVFATSAVPAKVGGYTYTLNVAGNGCLGELTLDPAANAAGPVFIVFVVNDGGKTETLALPMIPAPVSGCPGIVADCVADGIHQITCP